MADGLDDAWWEKEKKKSAKSDDGSSEDENHKKSKKKEKERSKYRSNGKHKSKDKERSKELDKSKDRDKEKSKDREKSKDKEKLKEKERSKEKSKRKKGSEDSDSETSSKKKKKSSSDESSKKSKSKRSSGSEDSGSDDEPEKMGTTTELMETLRRQFFGLLTPVEEDEMEVPESSFCPCRQSGETQTGYLSKQMKEWDEQVVAHKRKAAPIVLMVCQSGIRCVELKRELTDFLGKNCKTAKLFSKHMKVSVKIEEQEKYLKSHVVHFGVGTPHRLKSLIELEALSLSELTHVFVDWNWRDQKRRRLVDVSEARCELNNLLRAQVIPHLRKKRHVKMGLL